METNNKKATMADEPATGPVKVIRIEDVSVSIFARTREVSGETITYYSASFSRSYKDASGNRKYTKNFDSEDLGSVMALAQQASEFIEQARGMATPSRK